MAIMQQQQCIIQRMLIYFSTETVFSIFQNGMIRTERDDFLIEPVNLSTMHGSSDFIGQPHKLYKRSILDSKHQKFFEAQKSGMI